MTYGYPAKKTKSLFHVNQKESKVAAGTIEKRFGKPNLGRKKKW